MKLLRERGFLVDRSEHWNSFAHRRIDLFGFADLVALVPGGSGVLAVQVCWKDVPAHLEKIAATPAARAWLACGNRIVIHSWTKRGARGKRKTWQCAEQEITLADFENIKPAAPIAGAAQS
jgi:hypothetical protein